MMTGASNAATAATVAASVAVETREVRVARYGSPEVLVPTAGTCAPPGAGDLRIRQRAIGVNYLDVYLRRGWIPAMLPLPGVPGVEAAGTVLDVGSGVSGFLPGDRVAYVCARPGAYASVRCVPADCAVRVPDAVDDESAAALLLKGATADYLLRDLGRIGRGTRLYDDKYCFTIYDFVKAHHRFSGPECDGEPIAAEPNDPSPEPPPVHVPDRRR